MKHEFLKNVEIGEHFEFGDCLYVMAEGYQPVNINSGRILPKDVRFEKIGERVVEMVDIKNIPVERHKELEESKHIVDLIKHTNLEHNPEYQEIKQTIRDSDTLSRMGR